MTQYIYLLQEREFIRTKDNVYKVGMTRKENYERFKQYPKGSVLLFQMICNNCKSIEKLVLKKFKETFKQRKDIGNEYFEGEYKGMIDIIYLTIKDENAENVCIIEQEETENNRKDEEFSEDDNNDETDEELSEDDTEKYEITTYNEWIKYNNEISKVIITNKTREEGFIKLKDYLWIKLYNTNNFDAHEEYLLGFIENFQQEDLFKNKITNEFITFKDYCKLENDELNKYDLIYVEYNVEKILKDTLKKCYVKKCELYNLKYHEYVLFESGSNCVIYNSINTTFSPVDELISDKILTERDMGRWRSFHTNTFTINNTSIVDDILKSLIPNDIINEYKKLAYNLIVKQEEKEIIFYDYNECLLTTWIKDLFHVSNNKFYASSTNYYNDRKEFKKMLKTNKYRFVIIYGGNVMSSVEDQINTFRNLGFINFIVCRKNKQNTMYNIANYRKHLNDNKELLIQCIKEENNYVIENWESEIQHDDCIFYSSHLLLTKFLKWCCIK